MSLTQIEYMNMILNGEIPTPTIQGTKEQFSNENASSPKKKKKKKKK